MSKIEKVLRRIKKLLTQSEGERELGHTDAAEAFALKAQALLTEYKLELTDVERIEEEGANPFTYELVSPELWGQAEETQRVEVTEDLAATLCKAYFCRVLAVNERNALIIVGRKSDIEVSKLVLTTVLSSALRSCEGELTKAMLHITDIPGAITHWNRTGGNDEFRFSFFCGFNGRVSDRLREQFEHIVEASGSTALVKVEKEVDDYLDSLNPIRETEYNPRSVMMQTAFNRGMDYGDKVELSPRVLNTGRDTQQIGD